MLEGLPLLTATVKEALRCTPGASSPLLRVVPNGGATISGTAIPGGTVVGMSSLLVHTSKAIFKDPDAFNPDRWIGDDAIGLEQYLVAFSRGERTFIWDAA